MTDPRTRFRELHESGCFAIPNPWSPGAARWLEHLGFQAVATTSSGMAWSAARPDNGVTVDFSLAHIASVVEATSLPVNADFEHGFADAPGDVAANVRRCADTGVAGLSVEDTTGRSDEPLYDFDLAVDRIAAAAQALAGTGVLLTARAEVHLVGHPDPLPEAIRRLQAYAEAGADVLFAPGLRSAEAVEAVCSALAPRPVNVLWSGPGMTMDDLAALGARRVSVGGSLARAAWAAFDAAARQLLEGSFDGLAGALNGGDLNAVMRGSA